MEWGLPLPERDIFGATVILDLLCIFVSDFTFSAAVTFNTLLRTCALSKALFFMTTILLSCQH